MYEKLRLGEPKATRISLELADRSTAEDDECYGVDNLDNTINAEAQELLASDKSNTFLLKGLEELIDQSDRESCESFECKAVNNSDSGEPIRRIDSVNTPYPVESKTAKPNKVESEHLYSDSANKIDRIAIDRLPEPVNFSYARNVVHRDIGKVSKDLDSGLLVYKEPLSELRINALAFSDRHPTYHETPSDRLVLFRAEEMPSLISCWMAAKVMVGVSDVDVLLGGILSTKDNTGYDKDGDNDANGGNDDERAISGNSFFRNKEYRGLNSSDGGNIGDRVKIAGGVIGSGDEIGNVDKQNVAQSEVFKEENAPAERLHGLDQQMERKEDESLYFMDRTWVLLVEWVGGTIIRTKLIKTRLKAARDLQKSYADNRRKPLEFEVGDQVLLKVSPWKGPVAYRLRLPQELSSVHDMFPCGMNLKECVADANLNVPLDEIKIDKTLRFVEEPIEIMDREVKSLKRSKIPIVKVCWNSNRGPDFT
ncbi:hypothetical protein Tco_0858359 [Tanacetum coccineum]|uniref:Reverse transcriptase domain-containing protein n=1 Tax=Tanacetum coccineum TaxID=301880 RepID=A0ABQ5BBP0_9ASTR